MCFCTPEIKSPYCDSAICQAQFKKDTEDKKEKKLTIKVKDVKEFVRLEYALYTSGKGKKFFIALHAGPNIERYVVETNSERKGFTNVGEAVKYFNSI